MTEQRVILVDGVAGYWGGRVAEHLLAEADLHVIGLDTEPPQQGSGIDLFLTYYYIPADCANSQKFDRGWKFLPPKTFAPPCPPALRKLGRISKLFEKISDYAVCPGLKAFIAEAGMRIA